MVNLGKSQGGIQLPDDAVSCGYVQVKPFHWEQVFSSTKSSFKGTESEFVKAGYAYKFIRLDSHKILAIKAG